jgi:hypothetical protein
MKRENATKSGVFLPLGLLCLVWGSLVIVIQLADSPSLRSQHIHTRFVFADLDGDQKPDLALVEMQSQSSQAANYSIRLQFSRGMESAIGVRAPYGGLRVAARDVNGDDNLDLVLTSTLDANFIEVLLNDGHGNFSLASRGAVEKEGQNENALKGPVGARVDQASLALVRNSTEEGMATEKGIVRNMPSIIATQAIIRRARNRSLVRQPGRSPPSPVFL